MREVGPSTGCTPAHASTNLLVAQGHATNLPSSELETPETPI